MRITRKQLRRLVSEELGLREVRGNVQSEPEFGALLDAFQALEDKGFRADEISSALADHARAIPHAGEMR